MDIVALATNLNELNDEIEYLELDLLADKKELEKKQNEKAKILNELLFYDEFEELYKDNEKYELDSSLLYPFKESLDLNGDKVILRKDSEEYKQDVVTYIEMLQVAFDQGKIDQATFNEIKNKVEELANKQLDKIEEEEKKQEEKVDLIAEHEKILDSVEETKKAFIVHQIGEESYSSLCYKYKNMQEVERKELLYKTHVGICNQMGIKCQFDFTKYDFDEDKTVNKEGYCIKNKDINGIPFPFDTILLEQTFKLHINTILNNKNYTPKQKEELTKLLYKDLSVQKEMILEKIKKRELTPYGC